MPFTPDDPAPGAVVELANASDDVATLVRARYVVRPIRHAGRLHVAVPGAESFAQACAELQRVLDAEVPGWQRSGSAFLVEP